MPLIQSNMKRIKFFMNVASHYRAPLWSMLLNCSEWETHFFYGDNKIGIKSIDFESNQFSSKKENLHKVKNYWKGEIIIWQKGIIRECLRSKFDIAVIVGEISRMSNWISAIICKIRGIKIIIWAHGMYGNEKGLRLISKKAFFHLADNLMVYERRSKVLLVELGFSTDKIHVIFNSLDYDTQKLLRYKFSNLQKKELFPYLKDASLPILIFIGRLTKVKKLDLLLEAVNLINHNTAKVNLVIIGDGPEREILEKMGIDGIKDGWLSFTGECYDEDIISMKLSMSDLCVSPGNVGLTAIHSLSYGTPVCTHNNMSNQMPEAGAIIDGYNGFFFIEDDVIDLKNKIERWINNVDRDMVRINSYEVIDKYYNPHYQVNVIKRIVNGEDPEL